MDVSFKNKKLEKIFNSLKELEKTYGSLVKKIVARMAVLKNAANLKMVPKERPERCHKLSGNRNNQWAVDLDQNNRLIFELITNKNVNEVALEEITAIRIIEVTDYH